MSSLRRAAVAAAGLAATTRLLDLLERAGGGDPRIFRVLTYHRVADPGDPAFHPGVHSATPAAFAGQVEAVARRYRVIGLGEAVAALRGQAPLPPRAVLITFDDAYRDFAEHAWPVLRRLGLPCVVFVPTAFPGDPRRAFWWDRLHRALLLSRRSGTLPSPVGPLRLGSREERSEGFARVRDRVKALPHAAAMALVDEVCSALEPSPPAGSVLGWDALRTLAREGVALAAHTRNHPLLDRISAAEVRAEVEGSLADLRRELGEAPAVLAYPDGRYGQETLAAVRDAGVDVAFTTRRGLNDLRNFDPLQLRRVPVASRTTEAALRAQLLGFAALVGPPRADAGSPRGGLERVAAA